MPFSGYQRFEVELANFLPHERSFLVKVD